MQPLSFSHDFLHWSRFESFPGDCVRYTSPAFVSHCPLARTWTHIGVEPETVVEAEAVLEAGPVVEPETGTNRNAVAFFCDLTLVHAVLKWLHHPLL